MEEIWKDIPDYEGLYQISNFGNVKSLSNNKGHYRELIRKPRINKQGYYYLCIWKNGQAKTVKNHRLVAQMFIPNPENKICVNHKDGNKLNNHVDNLEWVTYSENTIHAINIGLVDMGTNSQLFKPGENNIMFGKKAATRRKVVQLDLDGNFIKEWDCIADAQHKYNTAHISAVCRGKRGYDKGFVWRYSEDYYAGIKPERKTRKKKVVE